MYAHSLRTTTTTKTKASKLTTPTTAVALTRRTCAQQELHDIGGDDTGDLRHVPWRDGRQIKNRKA
jgi:hypothetical protein